MNSNLAMTLMNPQMLLLWNIRKLLFLPIILLLAGCLTGEKGDLVEASNDHFIPAELAIVGLTAEANYYLNQMPDASSADGFHRLIRQRNGSLKVNGIVPVTFLDLGYFAKKNGFYFIAEIGDKYTFFQLYLNIGSKLAIQRNFEGLYIDELGASKENNIKIKEHIFGKFENKSEPKITSLKQLVDYYTYGLENDMLGFSARYKLYDASSKKAIESAISDYKAEFGNESYVSLVKLAKEKAADIARDMRVESKKANECVGMIWNEKFGLMKVINQCGFTAHFSVCTKSKTNAFLDLINGDLGSEERYYDCDYISADSGQEVTTFRWSGEESIGLAKIMTSAGYKITASK